MKAISRSLSNIVWRLNNVNNLSNWTHPNSATTLNLSLLGYSWTKMLVESLQYGGGLRWAVQAKGSGLYIAKTSLEKPAFQIRHWTTSMREVGGSLGLDGTSARGPATSKFHTCRSSSGSSTDRDKRSVNHSFWGHNGATRTNESPVERITLNNTRLSRANGGKA